MSQSYTSEFKKEIVRLHVEEGRTMKSITAEFGVSKASISKWCSEFSKECHKQAQAAPNCKTELDFMQENRRLRKELEEAKKENLFLKKAAAFFAKEID
jgi:transposase